MSFSRKTPLINTCIKESLKEVPISKKEMKPLKVHINSLTTLNEKNIVGVYNNLKNILEDLRYYACQHNLTNSNFDMLVNNVIKPNCTDELIHKKYQSALELSESTIPSFTDNDINLRKGEALANIAFLANRFAHLYPDIAESLNITDYYAITKKKEASFKIKNDALHLLIEYANSDEGKREGIVAYKYIDNEKSSEPYSKYQSIKQFTDLVCIYVPGYFEPFVFHYEKGTALFDDLPCHPDVKHIGTSRYPFRVSSKMEEAFEYIYSIKDHLFHDGKTDSIIQSINTYLNYTSKQFKTKNDILKNTIKNTTKATSNEEYIESLEKEDKHFPDSIKEILLNSKYVTFEKLHKKLTLIIKEKLLKKRISKEKMDMEIKKILLISKVKGKISYLNSFSKDSEEIQNLLDDIILTYNDDFENLFNGILPNRKTKASSNSKKKKEIPKITKKMPLKETVPPIKETVPETVPETDPLQKETDPLQKETDGLLEELKNYTNELTAILNEKARLEGELAKFNATYIDIMNKLENTRLLLSSSSNNGRN